MRDDASADVQRITLNASCITISDGRTKQLDIFCRVTGFMSDFLSFIIVELIRFFHGALQLLVSRSGTRFLTASMNQHLGGLWLGGVTTILCMGGSVTRHFINSNNVVTSVSLAEGCNPLSAIPVARCYFFMAFVGMKFTLPE